MANAEIALLLRILDEAYYRKAWHGANLRGSLRGLTVAQVLWRPNGDRHCIAEYTAHAAYWKYAVRRRLRGEERGSFPLTGSNWLLLPESFGEKDWKTYLRVLEGEHRALRSAVEELPADQLHVTPAGSKISNSTLIYGVAAHDTYHTGQIQLLKRLQKSK